MRADAIFVHFSSSQTLCEVRLFGSILTGTSREPGDSDIPVKWYSIFAKNKASGHLFNNYNAPECSASLTTGFIQANRNIFQPLRIEGRAISPALTMYVVLDKPYTIRSVAVWYSNSPKRMISKCNADIERMTVKLLTENLRSSLDANHRLDSQKYATCAEFSNVFKTRNLTQRYANCAQYTKKGSRSAMLKVHQIRYVLFELFDLRDSDYAWLNLQAISVNTVMLNLNAAPICKSVDAPGTAKIPLRNTATATNIEVLRTDVILELNESIIDVKRVFSSLFDGKPATCLSFFGIRLKFIFRFELSNVGAFRMSLGNQKFADHDVRISRIYRTSGPTKRGNCREYLNATAEIIG